MPAKPKFQPVHICQPKEDHNFGDLLGFEIAKRILAAKGITAVLYMAMPAEERANVKKLLIPIGTMFASTFVKSLPAGTEAHFWGCGYGCDMSFRLAEFPTVKVHGVRGPMSAGMLRLESPTRNDPGLLAPRYWPAQSDMDSRVVYASHINQGELPEEFLDAILADDVWQPACTAEEFEEKLADLLAPGMVICASLHAFLIRMAYKRPCALAWPPGQLPEYAFKYHDACALLGVAFQPINSLRAAWWWWDSFGKSAVIDETALDQLVSIFPCLK